MPINTNLNSAPYFDDYDLEKQYYRVMFKPSFAVQARELTQLQTTLQNQIEQLGDNTFKEGSIVKGCNFTELRDLQYVKLVDKADFDPAVYVGFTDTTTINGQQYERDNTYKITGAVSGLEAEIVAASRGFQTRDPDLNTFYVNYTTTSSGNKRFQAGELLTITKVSSVDVGTTTNVTSTDVETINVTNFPNPVGNSFGVRSAPGVIFQKGHFLYTEEQLAIVSKYSNQPDGVSIGYVVEETLVTPQQDSSLYDNANGSNNENAPGADRLKLTPTLTVLPTVDANDDVTFFTLRRYVNGLAVPLRDVSRNNAIGEELARRTFEESGDYIVKDFDTKVIRRNGTLSAAVSTGIAYVKGYRVENSSEKLLTVDAISASSVDTRVDQSVSFDYGGYVEILDTGTGGVVPLGDYSTVVIKNGASADIGTARVLNITNDKIFLFDIRQDTPGSAFDARTIHGSAGFVTIANTVSGAAFFDDASKAPLVFDTGSISLKSTDNIDLPVREKRSITGISGNTVTISPDVDEDFNVNNDDIYFVDSTNTTFDVVNVSLSGSDLVVQFNDTPASAGTIYFNKRILNAQPYTKASVDLYVKCTANTSNDPNIDPNDSKFNLGFPDVYEIVSITDSAGDDVTHSFRLFTNQKEAYYDHSYIQYIPGRKIPADGELVVQMKAFKLNDTTGKYFFTVDSYPSGIDKNKIQPYKSRTGKTYILRDCIDFRPHAEPISGANYTNASLLSTAPIVSDLDTGVNIAPSFNASNEILAPAYNQSAEIDTEFYFNRTDSVTIDSYGKVRLIKGIEEENSVAPNISGDQLKIADIYVPGLPALTQYEAYEQDRLEYGIKVYPTASKTYTMQDIENVEKKVDNLRDYVLLTSLEAETKNLNILDENGLERFKHGIIVDTFDNFRSSDIEDVEYSASIDFTEKSLNPSVKTFPLNLKYKSNSSATIYPSSSNANAATLSRNSDIKIIEQPYATASKNCVSNFYSYRGKGSLSPEYDPLYDVVKNPLSLQTSTSSSLSGFSDSIHELSPYISTNSGTLNPWIADRNSRSSTPIAETSTQIGTSSNEVNVGDFVSNKSFKPYMRAREIKIFMSGLRPNTRHYFFFDQVDVNANVAPGSSSNSVNSVTRNGNFGDAVTSDSNGRISAVFAIPAETFFVGNRNLEIADVSSYGSIESTSTSYGFLVYGANNFALKKNIFTSSTRAAKTAIARATSDRNVSRRIFEVLDSFYNSGPDPIAQTFFIKSGMGRGSDTVFLSKVDLYFKRKSTVNGITIEIREVLNGYPSYQVVPFSSVYLSSSAVSVSDDASVATTFNFSVPVKLDAEKEYALVVEPDAADPNYLVFTSQVGGENLVPGDNKGLVVAQDWGDGALFTSTNTRARQSDQDEDLKFAVYRHNFNSSTGSVTLTNDDHEFLTITNKSASFQTGETIYKLYNSDAATSNNVVVVSGNNQITGTGISTTYSAGDNIIVNDGGGNKQIFGVVSANSTVIVADRPASFSATAPGNPVTIGTLVHEDFRYTSFIIVENSSATSARKFGASDVIYGFDSGTSATISSVDNIEMSYVQPMIMRTNDSVTSTNLSGSFVDPNNTSNTYTKSMPFNDKTVFNKTGAIVFSKSNDINRTKTIDLTIQMANDGNVTSSPLVDIETSSLLVYQWKTTNSSVTTSKYISKPVELAQNLDAEDFQLRLTGYRPSGSNIRVYIRPQASGDPVLFDDNGWIRLQLTNSTNVYCSESNRYDFREFIYEVSDADKLQGSLTYTNEAGGFVGYRRFAIKIEMLSTDIFNAPRVLDYRGIALS